MLTIYFFDNFSLILYQYSFKVIAIPANAPIKTCIAALPVPGSMYAYASETNRPEKNNAGNTSVILGISFTFNY